MLAEIEGSVVVEPEDDTPDENFLDGMPMEKLLLVMPRDKLKDAIYRVVCGWQERNPSANLADAEQIKYYLSRGVRNDRIYAILTELGMENKLYVEKLCFMHKGKRCKTICSFLAAKEFDGMTGYFERDVTEVDDSFFCNTLGKILKINPLTDEVSPI